MDIKKDIIKATITAFNDKGIKFAMVDFVFSEIKEVEQQVLEETDGDTLTKLKAILSAMPDWYKDVDLGQYHRIIGKGHEIFRKIHLFCKLTIPFFHTIIYLSSWIVNDVLF